VAVPVNASANALDEQTLLLLFPPVAVIIPSMPRPNPDGWRGGSEDFDTVWTLHGHRSDALTIHFDPDDDPEQERGITPVRHSPLEK